MNVYEKALAKIKRDEKIKRKLSLTCQKGPTGPTGPAGSPGTGIQVKGYYDTYEDLIKEHPTGNPGDSYIVGTYIYYWNETTNNWHKSEIISGPTGPTGPKGEEGIQGVQGNIGPTGPTGPIGPQGLPGEIGISEHISIDTTETLEPTEEAQVLDDFENNIHHLTFYIPRGKDGPTGPRGLSGAVGPAGLEGKQGPIGPTGPTGPTGKSGGIGAYAERYNETTTQLELKANEETTVPLEGTSTALNANYDTENAITVSNLGIYMIFYRLSAAPSSDVTLLLKVKNNGVTLNASNITAEGANAFISEMTGYTIAGLSANDTITLSVESQAETTLTFNGNTNAKLSLIQLL